MSDARQHVHELIDRLPPAQLAAVSNLIEAFLHEEDEELTAEDRRALRASREYFRQGGEGLSLEQVAAECGLSMEQIRGPKGA